MLSEGQRESVNFSRRLRLSALLGTAALLMPAMAAPAFAQAAEEEATADDNAIIVTAQRRSEALEDVPMTVAVISQDSLSTNGVNSVRDLANVTTGLQVGNSGSYPQPAIRGITTINAGAYENNVATFVDGLYQFTPQILNMDLPNVKNVQVLKGPQGTLYGRNATGGAILIETLDPADVWGGNLEVTYGRFDDKRIRGYVAGPISEGIGLSIAGTMRGTDGYYKKASRTTPGEFDGHALGLSQQSLRAKLKVDFTDSFRATLAHSYIRASDPRGVFFTSIENVSTPYTGANATRPRGLGEVAGDAFALDLKQHESSLKLEFDTGIGTLRSQTGYTTGNLVTRYDADGTYAAGGYSDSLIHDKVWQENLDFTIDAIEGLDLILGGNYYNIKSAYEPGRANVNYTAPAGSPPGTPLSSYRKSQEIAFWRTKEAWAAFFDATFHATDRLSINIGGRYSEETQDVAAQKTLYCTTTGGCAGGVPLGGVTSVPYTRASSAQGSKYKKFTPRASIRYEIQPGTNVYASYSQGFRSGEWNSVPPSDTNLGLWKTNGQIGQESVNAYEIGIKSAGSRLRFEASAFYYDYKDLQVSTTVFSGGLAIVSLQSVPKAKVKGVEASVDYEVFDNFNLRAGATYLHARYGKGAYFVGTGVNPNVAGFNTNDDPIKTLGNKTSMGMDISGMQMARAPDFAAFLGFDYLIPQGDGGFKIAANAKYTDSYVVTNPSIWGGWVANPTDPLYNPAKVGQNDALLAGTPYADRANKQRARQGKYVLLNASVTWTDPTDHYYVRVWGNNLTNVKYRTHYNPSSSTYSPIGEPLTYGATVGYKF